MGPLTVNAKLRSSNVDDYIVMIRNVRPGSGSMAKIWESLPLVDTLDVQGGRVVACESRVDKVANIWSSIAKVSWRYALLASRRPNEFAYSVTRKVVASSNLPPNVVSPCGTL